MICVREEVFSIIFGKIKGKETEKPQNSEEPGAFLSFLVMNLRLPNILHNPSADLFCTVLCAAFHLDFGRADAGLRVISHHKERTFYWLLNKGITLQLAEKGDEERNAEIDQDAMEDGHEHEVVAGIARDDGKCGVHRGSSSRANRCQSSEVTDE